MEKDTDYLSFKSTTNPKLSFLFMSFFFSLLLFSSTKIKVWKDFPYSSFWSSLFIIFEKKINIMKSNLYSDKNNAIWVRFPVCTSSYLLVFKNFICQALNHTYRKGFKYLKLYKQSWKEVFFNIVNSELWTRSRSNCLLKFISGNFLDYELVHTSRRNQKIN